MTDHDRYLQSVWRVAEPLKQAWINAVKSGVDKDTLAVCMTRDLYKEIHANYATTIWSPNTVLPNPNILQGSDGECCATMFGMPIIIPSYHDNAKRCWLMQEIELIPIPQEGAEE